jgi:hypothetical protein
MFDILTSRRISPDVLLDVFAVFVVCLIIFQAQQLPQTEAQPSPQTEAQGRLDNFCQQLDTVPIIPNASMEASNQISALRALANCDKEVDPIVRLDNICSVLRNGLIPNTSKEASDQNAILSFLANCQQLG